MYLKLIYLVLAVLGFGVASKPKNSGLNATLKVEKKLNK